MARKNKNLAGFGDVATVNDNTNINNDVNINDNVNNNTDNNMDNNVNENMSINNSDNINNNANDNVDFIDQVLEGSKKKSTPTLMGFYPEEDLAKVLNMLSKKGGRGTKTKIINEALRKLFSEKGLL